MPSYTLDPAAGSELHSLGTHPKETPPLLRQPIVASLTATKERVYGYASRQRVNFFCWLLRPTACTSQCEVEQSQLAQEEWSDKLLWTQGWIFRFHIWREFLDKLSQIFWITVLCTCTCIIIWMPVSKLQISHSLLLPQASQQKYEYNIK
jgi:hypothetical protein